MNIIVYAASGTQVPEAYFNAARELGAEMARRGHTLLNGAGNMGLMAASANACLENGGEAVGVIPQFMVDEGWHHTGMTRLEIVDSMHARKARLMEIGDAAIALPGGPGTLEELAECITWKQLGLYSGPMVLLDINHYYEPLIEMFYRMARQRFMREECTEIFSVATTPAEALDLCESTPQWDRSKRGRALY